MIQNIEIEKLHEHPDNPRKEIGDVSELADSIKTSGILQNLTVVPCTGHYYGEYTVIIGHRRLAAAKLAGLTKLPCVVVEMDEKQQIATMLLENMQRSDLTIYEQAQGMQMMLELGETVEDIAKKTGFSQTTVRRRVRLSKLNDSIFKETEAREINIIDYDKLFEIEDDDRRNEVLKYIGTADFEWELKKAVKAEKEKKKLAEAIDTLNSFATDLSSTEGIDTKDLKYVSFISSNADCEKITPKDADTRKYYYEKQGSWMRLYAEKNVEDIEKENVSNEERIKKDEKKEKLSEIAERAFELRRMFIKELNVKSHIETVMQFAIEMLKQPSYGYSRTITVDDFLQYADVPENERENVLTRVSNGCGSLSNEKALFTMAYCKLFDSEHEKYSNLFGDYKENEKLNRIYGLLEKLGYERSEEECAWCDGTLKLYTEE